jgi:glycosyltransferase involved in cell wall biosynthesis
MAIRPGDVLLAVCLRNEAVRLPFFLDWYRRLGVAHVLAVDNGSTDGSLELLRDRPDVSLWRTEDSYRAARFGMDWIVHLLGRHAHDHWVVTADADEFLVYPFHDSRPLPALTGWLAQAGAQAYPAMLLDMYPEGAVDAQPYRPGADPFEIAGWFDAANYTIRPNRWYGNLWIQGGPRARTMFADRPRLAPSLNKIPLVRWRRGYAYVSSTHMLLPRGLNRRWDAAGGERPAGCLLHAKFLSTLPAKVAEEQERREHFAGGMEYDAYAAQLAGGGGFHTPWSTRYEGWRQLELLGLISRGGWA